MRNMYEIFDEFEAAPDKASKQAVLRKYYDSTLESVLRGTYHPGVKYVIEKWPYYKPDTESPPGMSYSTMAMELNRAYLFEANNPKTPPALTEERKYQLLGALLEGLEAREAIVYMNMLLKKQQAKGLTANFIKETFPGLLPS